MAAYPITGLFLFDPYSEQPQSVVERSPMDDGSAKQAKVRSSQYFQRPVRYRYSPTEYIALKMFIKNDIADGAAWFDWVDPLDGTTKQARMLGGNWQGDAIKAGEGQLPDWIVSFTLETLE